MVMVVVIIMIVIVVFVVMIIIMVIIMVIMVIIIMIIMVFFSCWSILKLSTSKPFNLWQRVNYICQVDDRRYFFSIFDCIIFCKSCCTGQQNQLCNVIYIQHFRFLYQNFF